MSERKNKDLDNVKCFNSDDQNRISEEERN